MAIIYGMTMQVNEKAQNYMPTPGKVITPTNTMKTATVSIPLFGHGLESVGNICQEPTVTGNFAADVVTGADGGKYAVFTVTDNYPGAPSAWAGTYRISVNRIAAAGLDLFA